MRPFKYSGTNTIHSATKMLAANVNAKFLAGGTNILDLMKEDVERPDELVDINRLNLIKVKMITTGALQGGVSIGALGTNTFI